MHLETEPPRWYRSTSQWTFLLSDTTINTRTMPCKPVYQQKSQICPFLQTLHIEAHHRWTHKIKNLTTIPSSTNTRRSIQWHPVHLRRLTICSCGYPYMCSGVRSRVPFTGQNGIYQAPKRLTHCLQCSCPPSSNTIATTICSQNNPTQGSRGYSWDTGNYSG
jgi:hypothetical protein